MKKVLLLSTVSVAFFSSTAFMVISSNGIVGRTGSPGEQTCSGCHGGGSGSTAVTISSSPAFSSNQYVPGQTYTITIDVANSGFSQFGFGCEILSSSNTNAGTMANASSGVAFANSGSRKNAIHTAPKSGSGSTTFSFEWTAPASGNATFYVAGNAVNGTGNTGGDTPGNTTLVLTPLATGIEQLAVSNLNLNVYPVPSNNNINLQYNLLSPGTVKIELVDFDGKIISEMLNDSQNPGMHDIETKMPSGISEGIYLLRFSLDGKTITQKMIVKK